MNKIDDITILRIYLNYMEKIIYVIYVAEGKKKRKEKRKPI